MPGSHHTAAPPRTNTPTVADLIGMEWDDYIAAFLEVDGAWRDDTAQQELKAMRLAPTLAIYQALMKGQEVPAGALDPTWRRRYGL